MTRASTQEFLKASKIIDEVIPKCSKDEITQCAKLLALALAQYKDKYGDIEMEVNLMNDLQSGLHDDLAKVLTMGLQEMGIALSTATQKPEIEASLSKLTAKVH